MTNFTARDWLGWGWVFFSTLIVICLMGANQATGSAIGLFGFLVILLPAALILRK